MLNKYTFIDFDGVILNSEERMLDRKYDLGYKNHKDENEFDDYFKYTEEHNCEWDYIIRGAKSINNSVEILRELESKNDNIAILTKIHTLYEMKVKVEDLRFHRHINLPIIFVPSGIKKHQVIIPNKQLLIDDSERNIIKWVENGGTGLVFDKNINEDMGDKVKSLEFLLKR